MKHSIYTFSSKIYNKCVFISLFTTVLVNAFSIMQIDVILLAHIYNILNVSNQSDNNYMAKYI